MCCLCANDASPGKCKNASKQLMNMVIKQTLRRQKLKTQTIVKVNHSLPVQRKSLPPALSLSLSHFLIGFPRRGEFVATAWRSSKVSFFTPCLWRRP